MKKKVLLLLILVFAINMVWEVSHTPLFTSELYMTSVGDYMGRLWVATLGDLFWIGLMLGIVSLRNKGAKWIDKPSKVDYGIIVVLSLIIAVFIELNGVGGGRWAYTSAMPTVFGIGLTPLIQLFTTALVSLFLVRNIS